MLEARRLRPAVRVDGAIVSALARAVACAVASCVLASSAAGSSHAQDVGAGASALPGLTTLRVAGTRDVGFALRGSVGYGATESVAGAPGAHHRVPVGLAMSARPTPFLGLALSLEGHGDFHGSDARGRDRGFVGAGAFEVRASPMIGERTSLGVAVAMKTAGGASPSIDLGATSFELSALAAHRIARTTVAAEVGYRIDRSANAVPSGAVYRRGDRLAIGYSDFDAVLVRLGVDHRRGALEAFGEISADLLRSSGRVPFAQSPMRASLGARAHPRDDVQLELHATFALSSRPTLTASALYVPIEPRASVGVSVTYRYTRPSAPSETAVDPSDAAAEPDPDASVDESDGRVIVGVVRDAHGAPLVDARVLVEVGDARIEGFSDAEGRIRIGGVPRGSGTLTIDAAGHAQLVRPIARGAISFGDDDLTMSETAPSGALRGLVRDFEARGVVATVRIRPSGPQVTTARDGSFALDLPPGRHHVVIEAPGFVTQERDVDLRLGEVTIFNVDLREAR